MVGSISGQVPREWDALSPGLLLTAPGPRSFSFLTKKTAARLNESQGEGQEEYRGSVIPGGGVWGRGCSCASSMREAGTIQWLRSWALEPDHLALNPGSPTY